MTALSVLDLVMIGEGKTFATRSKNPASWRGMSSNSTTAATGSPSTMTCRALARLPRRW